MDQLYLVKDLVERLETIQVLQGKITNQNFNRKIFNYLTFGLEVEREKAMEALEILSEGKWEDVNYEYED